MAKAQTQGVKNILATYYQATAAEIEYGLEWYNIAHKIAQRIAKANGLPVNVVAAVISALSPSNKWEKNVQDAEVLIQTFLAGGKMDGVKVSTYGQNKKKAWRILRLTEKLDGTDLNLAVWDEFSRAPKTDNFYQLIAHPYGHGVVVDGHAKNIWGGERMALKKTKSLTPKQYEAIAEDYRKAAKEVDILPHQMQAITWVAHRRIHGVA